MAGRAVSDPSSGRTLRTYELDPQDVRVMDAIPRWQRSAYVRRAIRLLAAREAEVDRMLDENHAPTLRLIDGGVL